ncbi:MAG: hypothetical protein WBD20_05345 [Pirellulaceae bacterium]
MRSHCEDDVVGIHRFTDEMLFQLRRRDVSDNVDFGKLWQGFLQIIRPAF